MAKKGNDAKSCDAGPKRLYIPPCVASLGGYATHIRSAMAKEVASRNARNRGSRT